jgi:hypothetical protein
LSSAIGQGGFGPDDLRPAVLLKPVDDLLEHGCNPGMLPRGCFEETDDPLSQVLHICGLIEKDRDSAPEFSYAVVKAAIRRAKEEARAR